MVNNVKKARERNWQIFQLKGILPRIIQLIPEDIKQDIGEDAIKELKTIIYKIRLSIENKKKVYFACSNCIDIKNKKPTKNKKAFTCDICGSYGYNNALYNI